jgi:PTS system nitrogen regulatory IIA component
MTFLSPFVSQQRILNKANLQSQKRVFEVLSNLLCSSEISNDLVYQKLFERERIGSTAIGKGVAVPHCRIAELSITKIAVLTLDQAIEYETPEQAVDIFIAVLFPENVTDVHIKFMAELVRFLKTAGCLEQIRQAQNNEELYQLFIK